MGYKYLPRHRLGGPDPDQPGLKLVRCSGEKMDGSRCTRRVGRNRRWDGEWRCHDHGGGVAPSVEELRAAASARDLIEDLRTTAARDGVGSFRGRVVNWRDDW